MVVFVPYTAPGDEVEVEITEQRDSFARGEVRRLLKPGPGRTDAPCPYFGACGGCTLQHLTYDHQLTAKRGLVQETLERIGGLRGISVKPVLGMKDPWRYRNKVQQPVGWSARDKRLVSGFFRPASHDLLPIDDCLLQPELSVRLINRAKDLLNEHGLRAYDEARNTGWIRHILARTSSLGQALLVFVTRTPDFFREREVVGALRREFPELVGVHQNVQPARSNVILGRQWRRIAGEDAMEERLGRLRFRLSAGSFFQVNTAQAIVLYDVAKRMAGSGPRLLDLYTGVGTIALWLADRFQEVGGVEENPQAIEDADANAALNGIDNARFIAQPVEGFLRGLDRRAGGRELTVVLDPPRAGCAPSVLDALVKLGPGRIVYVSCDPATLARDLKTLTAKGYRIDEVQPVDLFPQTPHIETAVRLSQGAR